MTNAKSLDLRTPLTLALIVLAFTAASAGQATFNLIHTFTDKHDGIAPLGSLINDKQGNLYGTTTRGGAFGYGSVFEVSPPGGSGDNWTETILHSFPGSPSDLQSPESGLVFDSVGNLYGTTSYGGPTSEGTIFEVSPPAVSGDAWSETVLYIFDSEATPSGLLRGPGGVLLGTTLSGPLAGCVYELKPPTLSGGAWKESNLFIFNGGSDGLEPMYQGGALVADKDGNLYGTTVFGGAFGNGEVFELSHPAAPGDAWTETVLYSFGGHGNDGLNSAGAVVFDVAGNLYGTTTSGGTHGFGTVYELLPPTAQGLPWTEKLIHSFSGGASDGSLAYAGLAIDKVRNLYGVTYTGGGGPCTFGTYSGCGTVFEVSPSSGGTWTETALHSFGGSTDGQWPYGSLVIDDSNHLFGDTSAGGTDGNGTVFEVVP